MIGIHTTYIRVKVPNLLIASNLRKLGGGSLCGKGAERSGSVTIEKLELQAKQLRSSREEEDLCGVLSSKSSRESLRDSLTPTSTASSVRSTSRGRAGTCLCWVPATDNTPRRLLPAGKAVLGKGRNVSLLTPLSAQAALCGVPEGTEPY